PLSHLRVHDQIISCAGQKLKQHELVVLVGVQAKLAPMVAIRQDVLIELRGLERLRQIRRVAGLNRLDEMPKGAIEGVHRCAMLQSSAEIRVGTPRLCFWRATLALL